MTGEMRKSEVTPEAYPIYFAAAFAHGGDVRPFDHYQGPYIFIPQRGRFWLCSDDGIAQYWYDETREVKSEMFCWEDDAAPTFAALIAG